jgi:hypothetical protein
MFCSSSLPVQGLSWFSSRLSVSGTLHWRDIKLRNGPTCSHICKGFTLYYNPKTDKFLHCPYLRDHSTLTHVNQAWINFDSRCSRLARLRLNLLLFTYSVHYLTTMIEYVNDKSVVRK